MYSTCLFCNARLGANEVIETFPVGRRLAFDAARGRLWAVCRRCERWNLSPIEERWEAIEDCERRFRAAKKRVASEQIGLARLGEGLELVRIGEPLRPEFAAWRYGDQFGRRRRRAIALGTVGVAAAGAVLAGGVATGFLAGGGWWAFHSANQIFQAARRRRRVATVPTANGGRLVVRGSHAERVGLRSDEAGERGWTLVLPHTRGTAVLEGPEATHAASLVLPAINRGGARKRVVSRAVAQIEEAGDAERFLHAAAREAQRRRRTARHELAPFLERRPPFSLLRRRLAEAVLEPRRAGVLTALPLETRLAVEMAVNEEVERIAMEGDLALLELAWREAEEIAAIADDLLVPEEVESRLRELRSAQRRA
jgi:hypothetical protein